MANGLKCANPADQSSNQGSLSRLAIFRECLEWQRKPKQVWRIRPFGAFLTNTRCPPSNATHTPARSASAYFSCNDDKQVVSISFTIHFSCMVRLLQRLVTEIEELSVPCMHYLNMTICSN